MKQEYDRLKVKDLFKTFMRVFGYVRPYVGLLLLVMFLNTIFSILSTASIAIIKPIFQLLFQNDNSNIKEVVGNVSFFESVKNSFYNLLNTLIFSKKGIHVTLINFSILIISIFLLKNIFKYFSSVVKSLLEENVVKSIRDSVYNKLTSLSVDFFTKRKEGSLISIITNDVGVVNSTTIISITDSLREITQIIIFLFLLISVSPFLTLIAFSTSIISLVLLRIALKYLRRYANRMQNAMADYTTILQETISGIRVVKAYNAEDTVLKRFMGETKNYVHSAVKHVKIITLIPSINEIFAIVSLCIVLYIGGTQVLVTKQMKADDLMLFLFTLFAIMSPIATVMNNISVFQRGFVAADRVFDVLDQKPSVETGKEHISDFNKIIEIKNINFKYENLPVLKDVSFTLQKSKKIAFVGASGSGKSTMLDLLIRFYDPQEGSILIDGKDITKLDLVSYRSLFGIVAQETILFHETIANNIRYGFEDASMEKIIEAAKIANAYNFIMAMPKGFDTIVGDRGITLSGGEKQRIAIARALVRNPHILVFDEATSALDTESEQVVQEAINQSLRDRTAVLVAHRLSTIVDCDEIFVFDDGKIVEHGRHKDLLEQYGIYRKLYDIQFNK